MEDTCKTVDEMIKDLITKEPTSGEAEVIIEAVLDMVRAPKVS